MNVRRYTKVDAARDRLAWHRAKTYPEPCACPRCDKDAETVKRWKMRKR